MFWTNKVLRCHQLTVLVSFYTEVRSQIWTVQNLACLCILILSTHFWFFQLLSLVWIFLTSWRISWSDVRRNMWRGSITTLGTATGNMGDRTQLECLFRSLESLDLFLISSYMRTPFSGLVADHSSDISHNFGLEHLHQ